MIHCLRQIDVRIRGLVVMTSALHCKSQRIAGSIPAGFNFAIEFFEYFFLFLVRRYGDLCLDFAAFCVHTRA